MDYTPLIVNKKPRLSSSSSSVESKGEVSDRSEGSAMIFNNFPGIPRATNLDSIVSPTEPPYKMVKIDHATRENSPPTLDTTAATSSTQNIFFPKLNKHDDDDDEDEEDDDYQESSASQSGEGFDNAESETSEESTDQDQHISIKSSSSTSGSASDDASIQADIKHTPILVDIDTSSVAAVAQEIIFAKGTDFIRKAPIKPPKSMLKSGIVYDARLMKHEPLHPDDLNHPESPDRLVAIFDALVKDGCIDLFERVHAVHATENDIELFHTKRHYRDIVSLQSAAISDILQKTSGYQSLFVNSHSAECAALSAGAVLKLVDAVWDRKVRNGFAVVRPPGHHAESDEAMGFCIYNNVAIAGLHLKVNRGVQRIVVLDWDIHHGNGTQQAFYNDPNVLFISIHRFDDGRFYPGSPLANYTFTGGPKAEGMNINIPWPCGGMSDMDYMYTFQSIIEPILHEFKPEIILVSCGFDAAKNDPIGGCFLSPEGFAHMTYILSQFAGGKVVLALEGGYHLGAISECAVACANVLLGFPVAAFSRETSISRECAETVESCKKQLSRFWKNLGFYHLHPNLSLSYSSAIDPYHSDPSSFRGRETREKAKIETPIFNFQQSLSDIMNKYRDKLFLKLGMRKLNFRGEGGEKYEEIIFDSHLNLKNVNEGDKTILFVHDRRPFIRSEDVGLHNVIQEQNSFSIDPSIPYLKKLNDENWKVIDITVNHYLPSAEVDRYDVIREKFERRVYFAKVQKLNRVLNAVYDLFFSKASRATRVIFLSGIASTWAPNLALKPNVDRSIDCVISVLPNNRLSEFTMPVLTSEVTKERKDWYELNTINLAYGYGDLWKLNKSHDCGLLISLGELQQREKINDVPEALTTHFVEIYKLIEGKWWWMKQ